MKKYLIYHQLIIVMVCLMACHEAKKKEPTDNTVTSPNMASSNITAPFEKVDTLVMEDAPYRMTRKIRKDRAGNLLFAALLDVILYDGTSFSHLPKVEGFERFDAFDALQDKKGHIWIASTHYGIFRYDDKDHMHFTTKNGLAHNRTMDLYEDRAGNLWIATLNGASRFDGKSFRNFTTNEGLIDHEVNTIIEDRTGRIWFGTRKGISVHDGNTWTSMGPEEGKNFQNVRHIMEDRKGHIWVGGVDGLWSYDGAHFKNISRNAVVHIHEDKEGNIWASAQNNITKDWLLTVYRKAAFTGEAMAALEIKTKEKMLFGINEDKQGNIWVGTLQGVLRQNKASSHYLDHQR